MATDAAITEPAVPEPAVPEPAGTEPAAAKINLTLHVTGQRADGYHLLDSLVVFVDQGDRITARHAPALSLTVTGPMACGMPLAGDNLVLRAARLIGADPPLALTLDKRLPVAAGIGGGSADAAATLRLLARLTGLPLPDAAALLSLGADVPVCLAGHPARMRGIGEVLDPVPPLPAFWLVLVNPAVAVPTPAIFRALTQRHNPAMPAVPQLADAGALAQWLAAQRNDLQAAAVTIEPVIAEVLAALAAQALCLLARMSGSGATCFGLFADEGSAMVATGALQAAHPGWWVAGTRPLAPQAERPTT